MGLSTSELYLILRARDEASRIVRGFSKTITDSNKAAMEQQQALFRQGTALATVGVVMGVVGVVGVNVLNKLADASIAYQQSVALTATQTDQAGISLKELSDIGLKAAKNLPVAFDKIQPTLYDIFSSIDVNAPQAAALLMGIGKAAVAGGADMQVAGRAAIAILNAYKRPATDVNAVNDIMFQLVRKGVGTYQEFAGVIGRSVPSAVKAGQSIESLAGMIAFLTRSGMSAAMASSSAARALDSLSKPKVIKNLQDMGISVYDSTGKFKPMVDIVSELKKKFEGLTPVLSAVKLNEIFKGSGANIQVMRFLNLAVSDTSNSLQTLTTDMNKSKGAADAAYKIMAATPEAKIALMKNQFSTMAVSVGAGFTIIKVAVADMITWFLKLFNMIPEPLRKFTGLFFGLVAIMTILAGLIVAGNGLWIMYGAAMQMGAMQGVLNMIKSLGALVIAQGEVAAAAIADAATMAAAWLASNPLGWIALFVAATAALWYGITRKTEDSGKALADASYANGFSSAQAYGNGYKSGWDKFVSSIGHGLSKLWDFTKFAVSAGVSGNMFKDAPTKPLGQFTKGGGKSLNILSPSERIQKDAAAQMKELQKLLDSLNKKPKVPGNTPIEDPITLRINALKDAIKQGAKDLSAASDLIPKAIKDLGKGSADSLISAMTAAQKAVDTLGKMTPNQLKKLGVSGVQGLIDGIKSKEAAVQEAMTKIQYKMLLREDIFRTMIAQAGAGVINKQMANMSGNLGKDSSGAAITFKLGADVIQAYAKGMTSADATVRLAARNTMADAIQSAYDATLTQLKQNVTDIQDKMKTYATSVSDAIKAVASFGDAYTANMDKAKKASEALAATNKLTLDKIQKQYEEDLKVKQKIFDKLQSKADSMASNIQSAIAGALDFKAAAAAANMDEISFMDELMLQAEKGKLFADRIKQLIAAGLSADALDQVVKAGADAGGTIADELLKGGAGTIAKANDLVKAANDAADTIAASTTDSYFKTGLAQAQSVVDGFIAANGPDSPGRVAMIKSLDDAVTLMANTMGDTFASALQAKADAATQYADKIKQLIALGISPDALTEVLAAGTTAGTAIADELIKGGVDAIKKTNDLVQSVKDAADLVGKNASDKFYGVGLASAQAIVDGFIKDFGPGGAKRATLMTEMDDIAAAMNRTATITIVTVNPDGTTSSSSQTTSKSTNTGARVQDYLSTTVPDNTSNPYGNVVPDSGTGTGYNGSQLDTKPLVQITNNITEAADAAQLAADLAFEIKQRVRL